MSLVRQRNIPVRVPLPGVMAAISIWLQLMTLPDMAHSQVPQPDFEALFRTQMQAGNYLAALHLCQMEARDAPPTSSPFYSDRALRLQYRAVACGAVGRYREAEAAFNAAFPSPVPPALPSPETLHLVNQVRLEPADQLVMNAVKRHQIVILNETHHEVEHRAYGSRLMPRLKALGVRYFALETGNQAALDAAVQSGHILPSTDPYSFEPQRAGLLRAVVRAGIAPVAFDYQTSAEEEDAAKHPERSVELREEAMARNIQEQILRRDPNAKILIWVGMGHASKAPIKFMERNVDLMARRLWKRTGIEPYCIYQLSDTGDRSTDASIYRLLVKETHHSFQKPVAVSLPMPGFGSAAPLTVRQHPIYGKMIDWGIDAVILHPADPFEHGSQRPSWHKQPRAATITGVVQGATPPAPVIHNGRDQVFLIQAWLPDQVPNGLPCGTPVDQVLTDARGRYRLQLPPGQYTLLIRATILTQNSDQVVMTVNNITCKPDLAQHYDLLVR